MRNTTRRIAAIMASVIIPAAPAFADDHAELVDFFAGQGCAIGPSTRAAAMEAGFGAEQIDALAQEESARDGAVSGGGWLVMAPEACTIRMPDIGGAVQLTDPEVAARISAPDAYLDEDSPGCFLDGPLVEALQASRGWDADTANLEYIRLLSRSLISGDLVFYSESILATPMGFQLTTGACADVPLMPKIRRSHEFLTRNFDPIMRGLMANNLCDEGIGGFLPHDVNELPGLAEGTATTNAWTPLEAMFVTLGAGWHEGMSATEKGQPRPPLCHYDAALSQNDTPVPPPAALPPAEQARFLNRKARRNPGGP